MDVDALVEALTSHSYRYANEIQLQDGIEQVLRERNFTFKREVDLGRKDRIDFVVHVPQNANVPPGEVYPIARVGVEVKIHEGLSAMTRQLGRYAQSPDLDILVFATSSRKLSALIPRELSGKRIVPCVIGGFV